MQLDRRMVVCHLNERVMLEGCIELLVQCEWLGDFSFMKMGLWIRVSLQEDILVIL